MKHHLIVVFYTTTCFFIFQNCTKAEFNSSSIEEVPIAAELPADSFGNTPEPLPINQEYDTGLVEGGLIGGHFDLDTSSKIYDIDKGKTDHHIHEYDKKYNVTHVDFFDMYDQKLGEIYEHISPDKQFALIIANSSLSPGVVLEINGLQQLAITYENAIKDYIVNPSLVPKVYTLSGASGAQLNSLKFFVDVNAIANGDLIPTATGCVRKNNLGENGEYRSGALTIQAVDINNVEFDLDKSVATQGLL